MMNYLALILISSLAYAMAATERITVVGQLVCGDKPANSKNTWVS
jgi:hypothetical protein